jgi:hypothetical protein
MECEVTFLSQANGGRRALPTLSGNVYRPHVVVGDPNQRKALMKGQTITEEYLSAFFESGPTNSAFDQPLFVVLLLPFWQPIPEFDKFKPGVTFTLREGPNIVGFGTALRWLTEPINQSS